MAEFVKETNQQELKINKQIAELVIQEIQSSQKKSPKASEAEKNYVKIPSITFFHKFTFALLGISALTGLNAILNALHFFQDKFPKNNFVDVAFYFPIPIMCSNFLVGVTLTIIGHNIPFEKSIPFSLRGAILSLISLCLVSVYLQQTQAGIILVFIILIFQGTMDSIANNSSVAISGATQSRLLTTNSKDRDFINYVNVFFLTFGITIGTIMAVVFEKK
ncbi:nucleoside transporter family protein, putative [Ichthyophthirius multifiliis]|uniref:Nucleoside transporter family protein, putative n=1 Tax=Ichthyophthirius multifiliis TaxID=5932 RepID=G0QYE6_ICHMU|nr:nucleoside transporter family protein, putative [Ichthyophthirius multifiliis]EGR29755.1 nucleoside transporter family protein, putative [Ichthyophthirius multifiliis]|eukprot:XP_004030991.1 nucleoside transporter family protein, putative [Ichthyophthirius multifiliis]